MQNKNTFSLRGQIVDIINETIFPGTVNISNGKIQSIVKEDVSETKYILPGLIDAHIHIESSMLTPSAFARLAVVHGTVATVSDPHEIANVLGIDGVDFMIENGRTVPFKFYFGAPSCVPATGFESAGAVLGVEEMEQLMSRPEIHYMAEMMNYPGVIFKDEEVLAKLAVAKKYGKPVDGHAPGLKGEEARAYIEAGITTDHECFTIEEALDKIKYGMKIQIREGSAAKNFDALVGLLHTHPDKVLFCSDDKHPDDLIKGHINLMVKKAISLGYNPLTVLRSCILNPVNHYKLDVGLLQKGDSADLIVVDNLKDFKVLSTYINGEKVAENGKTLIEYQQTDTPNHFNVDQIGVEDLQIKGSGSKIRIIEAIEGQLITNTILDYPLLENGFMVSDLKRDYLKMVVLNRYKKDKPSIAFIKNIGLTNGAIASTVAHDSHNIIAVGSDDALMVKAINTLIESKGGVVAVTNDQLDLLPLPVAGLMSAEDGQIVAKCYEKADALAKQAGTKLHAPFMTLSFMALLVIPQLKLSDKGLFDGSTFSFTSLEVA
ncbi:MAG: adenine deaminase [Bacteroidetes bacterium]|nr:MAG: adenine deaminase [Bacteroidota bacterium]